MKAIKKAAEIVSDTNKLIKPNILLHSEILSNILDSLEPINFREKAELTTSALAA